MKQHVTIRFTLSFLYTKADGFIEKSMSHKNWCLSFEFEQWTAIFIAMSSKCNNNKKLCTNENTCHDANGHVVLWCLLFIMHFVT